jgi:hypothetical protein
VTDGNPLGRHCILVFKSKDEAIEAGFRSLGCVGGERDNFPEIVASGIASRDGGIIILAVKSKIRSI